MDTQLTADLRRQALEFRRTGPHPHNRKPVDTTMRDLRSRRRRRTSNLALRRTRDLFSWRWELAG